jgi:hypothetical protein
MFLSNINETALAVHELFLLNKSRANKHAYNATAMHCA